jgi:signal transduction histidine kinase/HPt (histidine-containing phosphotransfer) domain-containing protein
MVPETTRGETDSRAVFAGRVDILYALGRHYLSLPFAALCMIATLFAAQRPSVIIFVPLIFQITVVIIAEQLTTAYKHRAPDSDPEFWARRYTFISAVAGATWGVGAIFWFVPNSFAAEAYLTLAFLGMTATEFIARSAHRPAYLAHALFALTPLVALLLFQGGLYSIMSAVLVVLFAAVLSTYSDGMARLLDESLFLRFDNAQLVVSLREQKDAAESARDEAEAANQAKSIFIANVSHELRTPLNALLGMAQILERADLDDVNRGHLKVMLDAGYGLKTLLEDVITLTTDDNRVAEDGCDPAHAARAVARLIQPRAWEKQLHLNVAAIAGVPYVAADPRRVRQVLLKLVDNALKFTEKGSVEIRVEREPNGFVRFTVADTGLGVPKEVAGRLFQPFSPGDPSYTRAQQGAGLGLAVAKRIVESLGGEIGFESEPGAGAAFWFTLPELQGGSGITAVPLAGAMAAPAPTDMSLLVFAPEANAAIAGLLEPFGNDVYIAEDLVDAIACAGRGTYDAIIVGAAHTDIVAGAPGVKAPILALISGNDQAPAGAHEIVRWPGPAGALYVALNTLQHRARVARAAKPKDKPEHASALDAEAIAALEKSVGLKTLVEILQAYIQTAEQLCRSLGAASDGENWDEAAKLAQDIAGSAGALGLVAMTAAAKGFATAAREHKNADDLRIRAQSILWEHGQVRRALTTLYPDLAA